MHVESMRAFIIKFVFVCIWAGLLYALLKYILPLLMPFFLAFLIAYLLQPVVGWVIRKTNLPRGLVASGLLIAFYAIAVALCVVLGAQLVIALRDMFVRLPDLYLSVIEPALDRAQDWLESVVSNLNPALPQMISGFGDSITQGIGSLVQTVSETALSWAGSFATALPSAFVKFIMTIVASFFCVVDFHKITGVLFRLIPQKTGVLLRRVKQKGIDVVFRFGKAYALLMTLTFAELLIGFALLGVENAFLSALCIAVVDILPVLGTGTILMPWAVAMLILGNFPLGIGLVILYAIITVVRQMLEPRVIGKQIGLYPLITLACMFVGTYLFGFLGLFGLPILATVVVQLAREGAFTAEKTGEPAESTSEKERET